MRQPKRLCNQSDSVRGSSASFRSGAAAQVRQNLMGFYGELMGFYSDFMGY